ncbi:hypothetical protein PMQ82_10765 [Bifidobacterium longum]|nr:hypothetical protein [Bifidobacterium longum]MDB6721243.1 hypothetical protein [Bifidobacterium longum]
MTDDIDSVLSSSDTIPDDVTTDVPPENEQDDATQVSDEFQKLELQEAKNALRYRRWFMGSARVFAHFGLRPSPWR